MGDERWVSRAAGEFPSPVSRHPYSSPVSRHRIRKLVIGFFKAQQILAETVLDRRAVAVADRHRVALRRDLRRQENRARCLVERGYPAIELLQVVHGAAAREAGR